MLRLICFLLIGILAGTALAQTDSTIWTRSFYAPNNETVLKVDRNDNVYLGYVSGSPSYFTLKKISPDGVILWSRSFPYLANTGTAAQLVVGPDGDPYLGWMSGGAELRRFNRVNGTVRWLINPPVLKFKFAVYEEVSVYGDRPTGSITAAQCLTYTLDGKLTANTGFESGYYAGDVWDGIVRYDIGAGPVSQRMVVKTRNPRANGPPQLLFGDRIYASYAWSIGALAVNTDAPLTRAIVGGATIEGALGEVFEYGVGRTAFDGWYPPNGPSYPAPIDIRTSSRAPYFSILNTGRDYWYVFAADQSPFAAWSSGVSTPSGVTFVSTFDGAGQPHTLWTKDGIGAKLDNLTLLATATQARSPQMEVDSKGHAIVSYIKQIGSPGVVVSKVWMATAANRIRKKTRIGQSIKFNAASSARGFDDGTTGPHFELATAPANGSATVFGDGTVYYTPNDDFVGRETFRYRVFKPGSSVDADIDIFVKPAVKSVSAVDTWSGYSTDITVTYDQPAPEATGEAFYVSFSPNLVRPFEPVYVLVNGTSGSAHFDLNTVTVDTTVTATLRAEAGGTFVTTFLVRKAQLADISMPPSIQSGNQIPFLVHMNGKMGENRLIDLVDDSPAVATPPQMQVALGVDSAFRYISSTAVAATSTCTITATLDGITATDTITLLP